MSSSNRLLTAIVIIHLLTNLAASVYLIAFQLDAVKQRQAATGQRAEIKAQNDFLVCILQTQPANRTPSVIEDCRKQFIK